MPDWWALAEVARHMGFGKSFAYSGPAAIFREHAALSAFENAGTRDFDIGGLAEISDGDYDALVPIQWPVRVNTPQGSKRMFGDGRFFTPSGRARFRAIAEPALAAAPSARFPLVLNTGRLRDQWHTMMRTGLSPRLANHAPEPFVEINPHDATRIGLNDGEFARITTACGAAVLRVVVNPTQPEGRVFAPIHWNDETAGGARVGALIHSITDSVSAQPDSKSVPAALERVSYRSHGFVIARRRSRLPGDTIWAWRAIDGGYVARIATNESFTRLLDAVGDGSASTEKATYHDRSREAYRAAMIAQGRLDAVLFLGRDGEVPAWKSLLPAWASKRLDEASRRLLLSGRSSSADLDASPTICACFGVTSRSIEAVIGEGAHTPDAIGTRLSAGTNCGSCVPELRRMIAVHASAREPIRSASRMGAGITQPTSR
jgi:assimilatory nitrate reductase catalytic subunit